MLCQLSYRGTAAARIVAALPFTRAQANSRNARRAPSRAPAGARRAARIVGGRSSSRWSSALAQAQQQLLGRRLVDPLGRGARVELGQQRDELASSGSPGPSRCSTRAAVELDVEVLRRRARRARARAPGARRTPASASRSSRVARLEQLRRDAARRAHARRGARPACVSLRQAEPVVGEPHAPPAAPAILGRARAPPARGRTPAAGPAPARARAARGSARYALGRGELRLEAVRRRRPGRCPAGSATTRTLEALRRRELHPAQRRRLAGGVARRSRGRAAASAATSSFSWRSVSAVPIDATTGSSPAWRSAITSVFPSTTTARSCFAIAARGEVEPVEEVALAEELALRRVDVLRRAAGRPRAACAPGSRRTRPRASASGKISRPREVVVAAPVDEPGRGELVAREALLARLARERRAAGREPEPELAADLLAERRGPRGSRARRLARAATPRGSARRSAAACSSSAWRRSRRRRSASGSGEASSYSSGTRKRSASHSIAPAKSRLSVSCDERDRVAALAAAEAVVELRRRVDGEARRPLVVERAEPRVAAPDLRSCVRAVDERRRCRRRP